jgi:hypothetical protein
MDEDVADAFERFMYARAQLTEVDQDLRAARLTSNRTFPLYAGSDLRAVGDAVQRYAKSAQRLARASDMLAEAIAASAPDCRARF